MHIITGDGGFDFSENFNNQENHIINLIFGQIMFALVIGYLAISLGCLILLVSLLLTELSRPRDALWSAIIMLLGLVLVNSYESLNGTPMLAVLFSSLIISRLLVEISQYRWQQLGEEEKASLKTLNRWKDSIKQVFLASTKLGSIFLEVFKLFKPKSKPSEIGKKWVRPEIDDEKKSSEGNIRSSDEVSIEENTLVSDQIPALKSGNKSSDIS